MIALLIHESVQDFSLVLALAMVTGAGFLIAFVNIEGRILLITVSEFWKCRLLLFFLLFFCFPTILMYWFWQCLSVVLFKILDSNFVLPGATVFSGVQQIFCMEQKVMYLFPMCFYLFFINSYFPVFAFV